MVSATLHCIVSLVWVVMMISIILFLFAVLFVQFTTEIRTHEQDGEDAQDLEQFFGSLPNGMYYLFSIISGGPEWTDIADPLLSADLLYGFLLIFYICFMVFAVLNIITGIFVEGAIGKAQADKDAMVQELHEEMESIAKELRTMFVHADNDQSGTIDINEFEEMLETRKVKDRLATLGLRVSDAWGLFRLLDTEKSYKIDIEDFIRGCLRLKDHASKMDIEGLLIELRKASSEQARGQLRVEEELANLHRQQIEISGQMTKAQSQLQFLS